MQEGCAIFRVINHRSAEAGRPSTRKLASKAELLQSKVVTKTGGSTKHVHKHTKHTSIPPSPISPRTTRPVAC